MLKTTEKMRIEKSILGEALTTESPNFSIKLFTKPNFRFKVVTKLQLKNLRQINNMAFSNILRSQSHISQVSTIFNITCSRVVSQ